MNERRLLLNFLASLTLCDHMGDVMNDVDKVLKELGVEDYWESRTGLAKILKNNFDDVTTLYGGEFIDDSELGGK